MPELYDRIGHGYPATQKEDPRIAHRLNAALGDARTVLNVGAGTGSYEPHERAPPGRPLGAVRRTIAP